MTNALLVLCTVLLVADYIVTLKWLRVSRTCLRAIEAQSKMMLDALGERGKDAP